MNSPLFITARFRTGSTMLWNLFHQLRECRSFYEPLHDSLISFIKCPIEPQKSHFFVKAYFDEYKIAQTPLSFHKSDFANQRLYLESDESYPELETYIQSLVESVPSHQTAVLQFNRIDFRLAWIRKSFPKARLLHLTRNPRDQWYSTLAAYDVDIDHSVDLDAYNLVTWARDLYKQFPFLATPQIEHAYQRFYYLWKLSYLAGRRLSDLSISYEDILTEPQKQLIKILNFSNLYSDNNLETCLRIVEPKPERAWRKDRSDDWFLDIEQKCEVVLDELGLNKNFALMPLSEIQANSTKYQALLNDPENDRWVVSSFKREIVSERNKNFELTWNLDQSYKNALYERDKMRNERDEVRIDLQGLRGDLEKVRTEWDRAREDLNSVRLDLQRLRADFEFSRVERDRLQAEFDNVRSDLGNVLNERDRLQAEFDNVRSDLDSVQTERDRLQSILNEAQTGLERIQTERDQVQAELNHVYNSRSYRITSPMRAIFGAARIWKAHLIKTNERPDACPEVSSVNNGLIGKPDVPVYMQLGDQNINLDEIMEKIREEVSMRNAQARRQDIIDHPLTMGNLVRINQQETRSFRLIKYAQLTLQKFPFYQPMYSIALKFKKHIPKYQIQGLTVAELLEYDDEDFVRNAYKTILGREPDGGGFIFYLSNLRSGSISKAAIVGRLRYSREGRRIGVKIKGLSVGYFIITFFRK